MPKARAGKVLVVDDEPEVRLLACQQLASAGWVAESFADGPETLQRLQADPAWDALVTDKDMLDMDGFEVARKARKLVPELAVVMITAHAEGLPKRPVDEIDAYVLKPFRTARELPEVVKRCVEARRTALTGPRARK